MHLKFLPLVLILLINSPTGAQPTDQQLFQDFKWRNIGPANQGGRIVDIEALDSDFTKVWAATGSGGVWHSKNAGTTWQPIFDDYSTASVGDIAINQSDPNIIWVGTGEANNRNSVSWGDGVYKSEDGGKTFQNVGLRSTHQIARIVLHPENSEVAYVAAIGHLWGKSGERGLFETQNGGETWEKLTNGLPTDIRTGCTDLIMDPQDPKTMYAAFYQRMRQPWHFTSGGSEGGIYKTTNGGKKWVKLQKGLYNGPTGRIGLAICQSRPNVVMAIVEAPKSRTLDTLGSGVYRSENGGDTWTYLNTFNHRPFYYSQIRLNPLDDQKVYIMTTNFMVSDDGGRTLTNGSKDQEVHGDFHALWNDPGNVDRYYLGADKGLSITHDHGQAFQLLDNLPIAQFYRINFDMRDPYYVYGGLQDNGMYGVASFARDARGILNDHNWKLHWGDGQFINPNPNDWREVYTSMENGTVFSYNAETYEMLRISPKANTISNYKEMVADSLQNTGREFRFNWTSPFHRSPHDPNLLYLAGNHVFLSSDKGNTWQIISPDLSTNDPVKRQKGRSGGITPDNTGAETHCAAYTMSISPIDPRLIWVGTDDGLVQVTRNGGLAWQNVRDLIPDVPKGTWVSRVEASHHDPRVVYVTFDGHRNDQNQPWIFKGEGYGQTWTNISNNLPYNEVLRVVREDPINPNLLFLGSETGTWASINGGDSWTRFMPNLPTVSIYDLKIHPRDKDLIAGTHGRSLWIMDDISPLQQLDATAQSHDAWLFKPKTATLWQNTSRGGQRGHFWYGGENPPTIKNTSTLPRAKFTNQAIISYLINNPFPEAPILEITDATGKFSKIDTLKNTPGIHRYIWNLEFDSRWMTEDEQLKVSQTFNKLMQQYSSASLRAAAAKFKNAKIARDQRLAVQMLRTGFLSLPIDETLSLPTAGPGTYILKLKAGQEEYLRKLSVRMDPIKRKN